MITIHVTVYDQDDKRRAIAEMRKNRPYLQWVSSARVKAPDGAYIRNAFRMKFQDREALTVSWRNGI